MRAAAPALGALVALLAVAAALWWPRDAPSARPPPAPESEGEFPSGGARTPIGVLLPAAEPGRGVEPRWAARNREAIAALEAGELVRAVELFDQCRAAVPSEPVFVLNLAEALSRLAAAQVERGGAREQHQALGHLERAAQLAPAREDLARRLSELRRRLELEQGMWTDLTEHFELSYDGERSELLGRWSEITAILESAYEDHGGWFGLHPVENGRPRIRVVLYQKGEFHDLTGVGHWAGGVYDGTVRVPIEDLTREKERLRSVLRHELMHAFVHEAGGRSVPAWLNEGLAQLREQGDPTLDAATVARARRQIEGQPPLPLSEVSGSLSQLGDAGRIERAYAQSLAFVAWIERQHGEEVLRALVRACGDGTGLEPACLQRTGLPLATLFEQFAEGL